MADTKWLTKRGGNAWHAIVAVPRKLRPVIGKSHLLKSLQTTDLVVARARRHTALAEFNAIIDDARRHSGAESVLDAAMVWREHRLVTRGGRLWPVQRGAGGPENLVGVYAKACISAKANAGASSSSV